MNNSPLVSIVTPSYNQGDYLSPAIESVLAQDYPYLEYGIVDGGSSDQTLDIINRYQDRLTWWVSEADQGQADAVNKGIRRSRGEIIGWLNSDDLYLPGAVRKAVAAMQRSGADLVFGNALTIDHQGILLNTLEFGHWELEELMRFRVICQPAVFIRKRAWEEVGGLNTRYHFMLDHHLWLKIASRFKVSFVDEFLAASRFHGEAKNVSSASDFAGEIRRLVDWMRESDILGDRYREDRRRILGGANRLSARYLLDGGEPAQALRIYLKALYYWPDYTLEHTHRIVYALMNTLTGRKRRPGIRRRKLNAWPVELDLEQWPGLDVNKQR